MGPSNLLLNCSAFARSDAAVLVGGLRRSSAEVVNGLAGLGLNTEFDEYNIREVVVGRTNEFRVGCGDKKACCGHESTRWMPSN